MREATELAELLDSRVRYTMCRIDQLHRHTSQGWILDSRQAKAEIRISTKASGLLLKLSLALQPEAATGLLRPAAAQVAQA